jgi:hypothetical protein
MGTQEKEMSRETKSIRRWTETPYPPETHDTTLLSDGFIINLHSIGRLKNIIDEPSKVISAMGNRGPCIGCIVEPNCTEMCDAKELSLIHDVNTRRERS